MMPTIEAVSASAPPLRLVTEALNGFVYTWTLADDLLVRGERFEAVLGYSLDEGEPTGSWWRRQIHPDDRLRADALLQQAIRSRDPVTRAEYRARHRDGHWLWLRDHMTLRYGARGLREVVGCVLDVDDERTTTLELRAERARRLQRDRQLRLALDVGRMGTWSVERETGETLLGGQQAEMVGLPPGTPVGHVDDFFRALHPEDRERLAGEIEDSWREREVFESEFRIVLDEQIHWIAARGEVFETPDGPRMIGISHDITPRKRVEEELRRQTGLLERQEKRKDFFLATLGHELRNPLAALDSGMRLLRRGDGDAEALHAMMSAHIDQLAQLVDDLLEASRIGRGKVCLRPMTIDLAAVVERSLESVQASILAKAQTLTTSLERLLLEGDPTRLEQVATNLLSNATKFTPAGGTIEVTIEHDVLADHALLVVQDSGPGIEPSLLDTLFEPFAQAESATEGLGIGLSLAHSLVSLHDGTLEVESAPRGSRFTVRLPRGTPDSIETPPERGLSGSFPVVDPQALEGLRVLVVDDVEASADALALLLEGDGCTAEAVYTGAQAIERSRTLRPHAVLLDLGLPDQPGDRVAPQLQGADGPPDIVAMTGFSDPATRRRVEEAGIGLQLLKPVDYEMVIDRLRRLRLGCADRA